MKIIQFLGSNASAKDVNRVQDRGNRLAIRFHEDTLLDFISNVRNKEGSSIEEKGTDSVETLKGIYIEMGCEVMARREAMLPLHSVVADDYGVSCTIHPFKGENKEYACKFYLSQGSEKDTMRYVELYEVTIG